MPDNAMALKPIRFRSILDVEVLGKKVRFRRFCDYLFLSREWAKRSFSRQSEILLLASRISYRFQFLDSTRPKI